MGVVHRKANLENEDLAMPEDTVNPAADSVQYKYDPLAGKNQQFVQTDRGIFGARALNPGDKTPISERQTVDVFCMVKKGSARIVDDGGNLLAELGEQDGIVIPSGTAYAIEAASDSV